MQRSGCGKWEVYSVTYHFEQTNYKSHATDEAFTGQAAPVYNFSWSHITFLTHTRVLQL